MTSRAVRKRERRRKARQQATAGPDIVERWGWGQPAHSVRGDLALIRKAVRERWAVPAAMRQALVDAVMQALESSDGPGMNSHQSARLSLAAVRTVMDMNWANILAERETLAERLALLRRKSPSWDAWRSSLGPPP
jgi:hypothetical protein